MAPVVHGLEQEYQGRIDLFYLNVAEARNDSAKRALGFTSTRHFFFRRANGSTVKVMQGVVPGDSVRRALEALLISDHPPRHYTSCAARSSLARRGSHDWPVGQHPRNRLYQNEDPRQFDERLRDDHGRYEDACRCRQRESER